MAAEAKVINANIEICNMIANSLDSSQARKWRRFLKASYHGNLCKLNTECRRSLNEVKTIGVEVGTRALAFSILTKLPGKLQSLIGKVSLSTETQGNPDSILFLLPDVALKQEAMNHSESDRKAIELNIQLFNSKTIHYCSSGQPNPLANHPIERFWQLHP
ncbi:hypothetical protein O181_031270 [Austropuccinia psidii MF-1]|uniref:Uncharacterized protein n=1 Tax=Austropuccinia psidii MF-1 TaxID=1389203 RepID=A0A9Q3CYQ9_9BASI|nr:hypothetical protein [Austropuccinia psidii MF-1]